MICDYDGYERAIQNRTDADINDLAELTPELYQIYGNEFKKRHSQQQEQARQQKKSQKQEQKAMYMSYNDFKRCFDEMDKVSLMHTDAESPTVKLSKFSREHPAIYQQYRKRMHDEDSKERRFKG